MIMTTSTPYQGMRWFKCDLHMHTPADAKNWRGEPLATNPVQSAEKYIRHCYECGLKVIAITDHNFSSKTFLPLLQKAITALSKEFGYEIILFPGFEINADVGKGMHVVALFEPDADLETIDHSLTNCGVPMPRQKENGIYEASTKRLPEIINEVQKSDDERRLKGIVVCAHPYETGIFDNVKISEWLQQQEWGNSELLAVEVPKPIDQMNNNWKLLFRNGADCMPEWKRLRPVAAIMSSDAKAYTEEENKENYIGKRFCWIKMSDPSVESLRQAFLDPESRLCLNPDPPRVNHTHIQEISIKNTKFLQDQTITFSPHLNCLIGGRGSGKSMVFESIRLGLRGETPFRDVSEKENVASRQVKRLRGTFTLQTAIHLRVIHNELNDTFVVENFGAPSRVENREVIDAATVFRNLDTLIFSQEEITQLAEQQQSLIDFIDNMARNRLESHRNKAREITDQLKMSQQVQSKLQRLDEELIVLKQEHEELSRQLAAKTTVQEELKKHRAAQEAKRFVEGIVAKAKENKELLTQIAEGLQSEPPPIGSRVESFPNPEFFKSAESQVTAAYQELVKCISSAVECFSANIFKATTDNPAWTNVIQSIKRAEMDFHAACRQKGLTIEEAEKLRETEQQLRVKSSDFQVKQTERDQTAKAMPDIANLLKELARCWKCETQERQNILDEIINSPTMPRTEQNDAIVKTSLRFASDEESFIKNWSALSPPGNTRAGRLWDRNSRDGSEENIGEVLFEAFIKNNLLIEKETTPGNPIQWLEENWEKADQWPSLLKRHRDEIANVREEKSDKWFEILLKRVPDSADLTLLRSDGSEAGTFLRGDLSTGQKNTAVLSLLLARGNGPVLIDQPEDELDSEFLFKELVPMFRAAKQQRQLIIVTHNANIPVNADADLLYALKAENGRGVCLAQGGLDRPEVTLAVLDIMEGSEEAFRRRQEKYHF
jgi:hypothetical protein